MEKQIRKKVNTIVRTSSENVEGSGILSNNLDVGLREEVGAALARIVMNPEVIEILSKADPMAHCLGLCALERLDYDIVEKTTGSIYSRFILRRYGDRFELQNLCEALANKLNGVREWRDTFDRQRDFGRYNQASRHLEAVADMLKIVLNELDV